MISVPATGSSPRRPGGARRDRDGGSPRSVRSVRGEGPGRPRADRPLLAAERPSAGAARRCLRGSRTPGRVRSAPGPPPGRGIGALSGRRRGPGGVGLGLGPSLSRRRPLSEALVPPGGVARTLQCVAANPRGGARPLLGVWRRSHPGRAGARGVLAVISRGFPGLSARIHGSGRQRLRLLRARPFRPFRPGGGFAHAPGGCPPRGPDGRPPARVVVPSVRAPGPRGVASAYGFRPARRWRGAGVFAGPVGARRGARGGRRRATPRRSRPRHARAAGAGRASSTASAGTALHIGISRHWSISSSWLTRESRGARTRPAFT